MSICIVGSINTDIVVRVPHIARAGETVIGHGGYSVHQGGKGANQAVAAAAAGADTAMIGRIGTDPFGGLARQSLEDASVQCAAVGTDPQASTGMASILVDDTADNAIAVAPGANATLSPAHIEAQQRLIAEAAYLVVQLEIPLETVAASIHQAKKAGTKVILNPAPAPASALPFLDQVDILTPNEIEAEMLTGLSGAAPEALADALHQDGVAHVALTLGAQGCLLSTPDGHHRIATPPVEAVDTTGAGDTFTGYLAAALDRGLEMEEAARLACHAASLAVTRPGARENMPRWDEVQAFMT